MDSERSITKKVLQVGNQTFTFYLSGRIILNQQEFVNLVKLVKPKLLTFCYKNYRQIPSYEVDDLMQAILLTLNACIYTYCNEKVARTQKRASFMTYFWSIARNEYINRKVTETKERTIRRLEQSGACQEALKVWNIINPLSLDELCETTDLDFLGIEPVSD